MEINNVKYDIDFTEADFIEKYEEGYKILQNKSEELENKEMTSAEGIRQECKIIKEFLNYVLGDGEADKIITKDSLNQCIKALEDIKEAKDKQELDIQMKLSKYSPDRLKR